MSSPVLTPEAVERLAGKRVLVVGDIMLDAYLMGDADRISPEAPVPVVRIESERYLLGGAGNVARNIAALGGVATLAGAVGEDGSASQVRSLVNAEGIRSALIPFSGRPTTVKTRIMARRQQMLRLDQEDARPFSAAEQEAVLDVLAAELADHDVVILSDYNKGLVSAPFMARFRALLAGCGHPVKVLVDPKPGNAALYGGSYLLTPNTKETGECAGLPVRNREEILAAGRAILEKVGCPYLLTTLGPDGMALFSGPDVWHVPTMAQDVFDVTGAGDTVIASVGLGLAAGLELLPACVLANYAAGLVVAQVGAAVASPQALRQVIDELPVTISKW
ncbi:MAG TPA: D-glycero-beta-D-manno-heptose-7-phosphate kinase [Candidatus Bilophila faecipullorum]|uniref:D-glycero-beta-D-manno-heptose-7-phosphate kinase n=1 Tax=Candidatus Bilophila faecipullorum TaxID=2838482 RepID=A0A9D1R177_9BACT|nr:PfkB family carbohydrate kinase [uncultured Bilophila sp.]HIW78251.1 D-glycero-beta-D-manno-heptose-7-phosphate kinase [Candidatus Bilophila faecipullorum]